MILMFIKSSFFQIPLVIAYPSLSPHNIKASSALPLSWLALCCTLLVTVGVMGPLRCTRWAVATQLHALQ